MPPWRCSASWFSFSTNIRSWQQTKKGDLAGSGEELRKAEGYLPLLQGSILPMDGLPSQGLTAPGPSVASQQLIEKTLQASAPKCKGSRLAKSDESPEVQLSGSPPSPLPPPPLPLLLLGLNVPMNSIEELPPRPRQPFPRCPFHAQFALQRNQWCSFLSASLSAWKGPARRAVEFNKSQEKQGGRECTRGMCSGERTAACCCSSQREGEGGGTTKQNPTNNTTKSMTAKCHHTPESRQSLRQADASPLAPSPRDPTAPS